jgi:hypothetical protein
MIGRANRKAWEQRFSLYDIHGFRLMAAAMYHTHTLTGRQSEAGYWRSVLSEVEASNAEIVAGKTAILHDFIFCPADLWQHQRLAMFVVEGQNEYWPEFDGDSPICQNDDLRPQIDSLCSILEQYFLWHMAPKDAKPEFNIEFPRTVEHYHWCNYLAPYCDKPRGRGHPNGPRWLDGRRDAASHAWGLLYSADRKGLRLSVSKAVKIAVSAFDLRLLTDPKLPRREADRCIIATSEEQAEKYVRKLLEDMIEREPPWAPLDDLLMIEPKR